MSAVIFVSRDGATGIDGMRRTPQLVVDRLARLIQPIDRDRRLTELIVNRLELVVLRVGGQPAKS